MYERVCVQREEKERESVCVCVCLYLPCDNCALLLPWERETDTVDAVQILLIELLGWRRRRLVVVWWMCMLKYVCVCMRVFDERWHVGRGGCVASSLRWSPGVAGVDYVPRGQEKLCLTSETKLTWRRAWESSSLVYARMLCVCQREGERGRGSEAMMRGKETMPVCVCGKAEERD